MKSVMLLPISLGLGLVAVMFGTFTPQLSTDWFALGILVEETERYKTEIIGERSDGALIYQTTIFPTSIQTDKLTDDKLDWDVTSIPDVAIMTDNDKVFVIIEQKQWWEFWRWFE